MLGQADADGGGHAVATGMAGNRLREPDGQRTPQLRRKKPPVSREQGDKLLPPDAGQDCLRTDDVAGNTGEQPEHRVARGMAVLIVDRLEVIQVEREQRERFIGSPRAKAALPRFEEPPAVAETRQVIGSRCFQKLSLGFLSDQREQRHRKAHRIEHPFIHGDRTGDLPDLPTEDRFAPGKQKGTTEIAERMDRGQQHDDPITAQRPEERASMQFERR